MKQFAITLALLGTLALAGTLTGCKEQGSAEQAGEDAGRAVDDAMNKAGKAMDDLKNN